MWTAESGFWKRVSLSWWTRWLQGFGTTAGVTELQEWSGELGRQWAGRPSKGQEELTDRVQMAGRGMVEQEGFGSKQSGRNRLQDTSDKLKTIQQG